MSQWVAESHRLKLNQLCEIAARQIVLAFDKILSTMNARAYTLLELVITLAIVAVAAVWAMPHLHAMLARAHAKTQLHAIQQHLAWARAQAVQGGQEVQVRAAKAADWSAGWEIVRCEQGKEQVLRKAAALRGQQRLRYRGFTSHSRLRFLPQGWLAENGRFTFCAKGLPHCWQLIVNRAGRTRLLELS